MGAGSSHQQIDDSISPPEAAFWAASIFLARAMADFCPLPPPMVQVDEFSKNVYRYMPEAGLLLTGLGYYALYGESCN